MRLYQPEKLLPCKTVTKLKRQPRECSKIFASCTFEKGLKTRIYRELKELISQNIN
jgi:hypothetical protein